MNDQFWLRRAALDPQTQISISEDRFNLLRDARQTLVDAGAFEQKYEILLGNYLAVEEFCTQCALRGEIEFDHRHETWAMIILEANRRIMNLFTAGKAYVDQVASDFKHLALSPPFGEQAEQLLNKAFDSSLHYKFAYRLRNHVQHRAAPVHGITSRAKSDCWADSFVIYCSKEKLKEDKKNFGKGFLAQLDEQIDLRAVSRGYMHELSKAHIALRRLVNDTCAAARNDITTAMTDFMAAQQDENGRSSAVGLTICRESAGTFHDVHHMLLDWDNVRVILAEKNLFPVTMFNRPVRQ